MAVARTGTAPLRRSDRQRPEFADFVNSLGSEARSLARPTRAVAGVFLVVAILSWSLWFSSYSLDSFTSFVVCVASLLLVVTPGIVFVWLASSLRQLACLPSRLPPTRSPAPPPPSPELERQASHDEAAAWHQKVRARVDHVLELWAHLSLSKEELEELAGPSRSLSFLAHSASAFVVAGALLVGAFVLVAAVLLALSSLASRIL